MMDSQDIFNSSLAIFSTATFMEIENTVDKIHKYIAQESNVKDMHRLIKMILDIVRIKKISEEEKVFLLKDNTVAVLLLSTLLSSYNPEMLRRWRL